MVDVSSIFSQWPHASHEEHESRPLHEAQMSSLQEIFSAYAVCPYKPGDYVTPRSTSGQPDDLKGEPHIVLEVRDAADLCATDDDEGSRYLDMRVAVYFDGVYIAPWVESFEFEPYVAKED